MAKVEKWHDNIGLLEPSLRSVRQLVKGRLEGLSLGQEPVRKEV
jgi:hypothetical protein